MSYNVYVGKSKFLSISISHHRNRQAGLEQEIGDGKQHRAVEKVFNIFRQGDFIKKYLPFRFNIVLAGLGNLSCKIIMSSMVNSVNDTDSRNRFAWFPPPRVFVLG